MQKHALSSEFKLFFVKLPIPQTLYPSDLISVYYISQMVAINNIFHKRLLKVSFTEAGVNLMERVYTGHVNMKIYWICALSACFLLINGCSIFVIPENDDRPLLKELVGCWHSDKLIEDAEESCSVLCIQEDSTFTFLQTSHGPSGNYFFEEYGLFSISVPNVVGGIYTHEWNYKTFYALKTEKGIYESKNYGYADIRLSGFELYGFAPIRNTYTQASGKPLHLISNSSICGNISMLADKIQIGKELLR